MQNDRKEIRKLTQCLFLSGALNIVLASFFFYGMIRERPPTPYFELKPANIDEQQVPVAMDHSNEEIIRYFKSLSFESLLTKLSHAELVESGYTVRDLALSCLVTFHHFDLRRALLDDVQPTQARILSFGLKKDGKQAKVLVYPGLTDKQFESIMRFAKRERWPLTSKGLFSNLKHKNEDHFLADAFYLTPEFLSVETLFNRSEIGIEKSEILNVLLDGSFVMLSSFSEHQKQSHDLTAARRQHFLLEYIKNNSKAAAYLLLKTDGPAMVRKLDDEHVIKMLSLLTENTHDAGKFALALLTSPRSDAVWKMATIRLYGYAGEVIPEKFHYEQALHKFLPANLSLKKTREQSAIPFENIANALPQNHGIKNIESINPSNRETLYVVQEGDSLWKISRRYDVDIDLLKKINQLNSDFLKPGTILKIHLQ